jgi:hypothetical protein
MKTEIKTNSRANFFRQRKYYEKKDPDGFNEKGLGKDRVIASAMCVDNLTGHLGTDWAKITVQVHYASLIVTRTCLPKSNRALGLPPSPQTEKRSGWMGELRTADSSHGASSRECGGCGILSKWGRSTCVQVMCRSLSVVLIHINSNPPPGVSKNSIAMNSVKFPRIFGLGFLKFESKDICLINLFDLQLGIRKKHDFRNDWIKSSSLNGNYPLISSKGRLLNRNLFQENSFYFIKHTLVDLFFIKLVYKKCQIIKYSQKYTRRKKIKMPDFFRVYTTTC